MSPPLPGSDVIVPHWAPAGGAGDDRVELLGPCRPLRVRTGEPEPDHRRVHRSDQRHRRVSRGERPEHGTDRSGGLGHAAPQPAAGFGHSNVEEAGTGEPGEISRDRDRVVLAVPAGRPAIRPPVSPTSPVSAAHVVPMWHTLRLGTNRFGRRPFGTVCKSGGRRVVRLTRCALVAASPGSLGAGHLCAPSGVWGMVWFGRRSGGRNHGDSVQRRAEVVAVALLGDTGVHTDADRDTSGAANAPGPARRGSPPPRSPLRPPTRTPPRSRHQPLRRCSHDRARLRPG